MQVFGGRHSDTCPLQSGTQGNPLPKKPTNGVYSSIWNADDWATQGGRVKTDWTHAPFVASYKGFQIDACACPSTVAAAENAAAVLQHRREAVLVGRADRVGAELAPEPPAVVGEG